ncbi:hypothetical protein [Streptomyces sp. CA-106131]|uniref:hypothetical protein n=1 Tax=Streptomyces sp. CA-106131 TaxID=3240045 RepID=UPI003D8A7BEB
MSGDMTQQMSLVLTGGPGSDQEELDTLTVHLRERLLELDVERVTLRRQGTAPAGAKPGEVIAVGALTVTMAPVVLRAVLRLLETWIRNRPVRTIRVTIGEDSVEIKGVSSAGERRLIDTFSTVHSPTPSPETDLGPQPQARRSPRAADAN